MKREKRAQRQQADEGKLERGRERDRDRETKRVKEGERKRDSRLTLA